MNIDKNIFDPSLLSFPDCDFLLKHAGEPPIVALRELTERENKVTISQWLERFYELEELEKNRQVPWAGVEAIKAAINVYLKERAKWAQDEKYGAPKHPSMYAFDARGNGHLGAPGSDSSRVKTYFDAEGKRLPFALNIVDSSNTGTWKPSWVKPQTKASIMQLREVAEENCWKCGVPGCGHTETYKPDSRASRAAARARMSKHLRNSVNETEAHLELHTLEFGS
jgi:hypothetical protein